MLMKKCSLSPSQYNVHCYRVLIEQLVHLIHQATYSIIWGKTVASCLYSPQSSYIANIVHLWLSDTKMFCYRPNISLTFHVDISYSNGSFYQSKCILLFNFFCGMPRISELRTWQMASSCFVPGAQYWLFYWPGCSWSRKHPSPLLPGQTQQSDSINSTHSIHSSHCTHSTHPSPLLPGQPQQSDCINISGFPFCLSISILIFNSISSSQ